MKIVRDGKEIELTHDEVYTAYREYHTDCLKEDILGTISQMEVEVPDELMNKIMARAEKTLDNNDSYWESYWMSIEYAIDSVVEDN
jgi:hypothetical protein